MDRVRNEEVHRIAGIKIELASRADQGVLRWFGHVGRMKQYRMARMVFMHSEYCLWCNTGTALAQHLAF